MRTVGLLLAALLVAGAVFSLAARRSGEGPASRVVGMTLPTGGEYARADSPRPLQFPRDHGPHLDFQTEWWYYTGNLSSATGERFGYQLTFFRRAIIPAAERVERESDWATEQVYLAHFTLTAERGRTFRAFERVERGAAGLSGAAGEPGYSVWLDDWSVEQTGEDTYRLLASADDISLDLAMEDVKGPVLQGEEGYSQKGPEPGNASYYYSQTRLESQGSISIAGRLSEVSGASWMDHEYSTSALSPGQVGWDWFALQLDDGSELMVYTIRREDGSLDPYSRGMFVAPDGSAHPLGSQDFQVIAKDTWRSPHSGGVYPSEWSVAVPSEGIELEIRPLIPDQELNLSFTYWEGAVEIVGTRSGQALTGSGYVELTGYAGSMAGQF